MTKLISGFWAILLLIFGGAMAHAGYPSQGDIVPNDIALGNPIKPSVGNEITIVSWNIRNLGAYSRSIKDYTAMVDLVDEADVIVLQEVGLGLLKSELLTPAQEKTLASVKALWQIQLGEDWQVQLAAGGSGAGRETSMVAHRKITNGKTLDVAFNGFHELGESRDMPLWTVTVAGFTTILIGSVHLTPNDPMRGREMLNMLDWLVSNKNRNAMVMGDMNYGYQRTSNVENYLGEHNIMALDNDGTIFHLFKNLSYLGKGSATSLRTNLGFRNGAYFYDQFLLTPSLAAVLSHGGVLLKDVGMIAFGVHNSYMKKVMDKSQGNRSYALKKYEKYEGKSINQTHFAKAIQDAVTQGSNDATWAISDHRPIWLKLNIP